MSQFGQLQQPGLEPVVVSDDIVVGSAHVRYRIDDVGRELIVNMTAVLGSVIAAQTIQYVLFVE